ncbi:MAG: hypothetical protein GF350_10355 [Chitinivibrionales bacterium]|nr:hypothetical protein [Chitinivibrionales bacterium]
MSVQSVQGNSDQWARFMELAHAAKARNPGLSGVRQNPQTQLQSALKRLSGELAAHGPTQPQKAVTYGMKTPATVRSKILGGNFDAYA